MPGFVIGLIHPHARGHRPAVKARERHRLLLLESVRGPAVGVGARYAFGVGQSVNLAPNLREGLGDLQLFEPVAPRLYRCNIAVHRVPQADGRAREVDRLSRDRHQRVAIWIRQCGVFAPPFALHQPHQPPSKAAQQRLLKILLTPIVERPAAVLQIELLQALRLDRKVGLKLFQIRFLFLQPLFFFLDRSGRRFEPILSANTCRQRTISTTKQS